MKIVITALIIIILTLPQAIFSADQATEKVAAEPATEKSAEAKTAKPAEMSFVGTVAEVMIGGSYLYLKMDLQGEEIWLATNPAYPGSKVEAGEKLEFSGGVEMMNFKSKALDRTFDRILFITKIRKFDAKPIGDLEHVPADQLHSKYVKENKPAKAPTPGEISKPENGKTIEELFREKDSLKDKEIVFRGRVMKLSKNIMKKNWITLQDGTGTSPDNMIVATSSESANAGETVTVRGTLKSDVDLGAGYFYKVLIENATFTK